MRFFFLFFITLIFGLTAQNKPVLYGFDNIPQGLLLNPGAEANYKAHVGVPLLSGLHVSANISGITVADVFSDESIGVIPGIDFTTKVSNAIESLGDKDYLSINSQVEVLSGGYKINKRDYVSGGFYTEFDAFVGFPKQLLQLARDGALPYLGRSFTLNDVNVTADLLGVLHLGISRRMSERITAGARFKIYSGSLNVNSTNNSGTFVTREGENSIYDHSLFSVDGEVNSSGFFDDNDETPDESIVGNTFLSKNFGVGFDFGLTYHINEQLEFTASILDLGFLTYSKNTRNATLNGSYHYSGEEFIFDGFNINRQALNTLEDSVVYADNRDSYTVLRPLKFNSSIRYSFGKSRYLATCHDIRMKDFYDNAIGAQVFSVLRPNGIRMALTGFYERKFASFLNTKVTWTIDDFSATNIGLGVSTNIWKINLYGAVNNVFGLADVSNTHTAGIQFGINLLLN